MVKDSAVSAYAYSFVASWLKWTLLRTKHRFFGLKGLSILTGLYKAVNLVPKIRKDPLPLESL